jgi:ribose transport system permease protein
VKLEISEHHRERLGEMVSRLPFRNVRNVMVYIAFVVLFIVFAITLKDVGSGFASLGNLMNILRQTSLIAIMAVGMTFVLGAGQIDLSVGSVVGVVSLVTAIVVRDYGILAGVLAGLGVGALAGTLNGLLISRVRLPAFLATLGTQIIFAGISRTMTNLRSIPITNSTYRFFFGGGSIGPIPILFVWTIVITIIGHLALAKGKYGRRVIATGGHPKAAFYSGINVNKIRFQVMLVSGLLAAVAGILWAGRFGGGRYSLGEGEELSAIAAAVLGGTSIAGGKATVLGAVIGAIMIGMINNALILYGLDVYQQMIIRGIVIILAVASTSSKSDH